MEHAMSEREIILVDTDSKVRTQMADSFRKEGYRVDTTDSTAHLLCTLLEKQMPVVLLGSGSDKNLALAELVPLLKKCNRGVSIILVSDEEALPTYRSIRQEGIFYHALKPTGRDDTEEILAAVACAFNKTERSEKIPTDRAAAHYETVPVPAMPCAAALVSGHQGTAPVPEIPCAAAVMSEQVPVELPEAVAACCIGEPQQAEERRTRAKAAAILSVLGVTVLGLVYYIAAVTNGMKESNDLALWAFLGFFALVFVGRLLPVCFSARGASKVAAQRLQDNFAGVGTQQQAHDVPEKNK
jgi:FixJ family two-component response regulator